MAQTHERRKEIYYHGAEGQLYGIYDCIAKRFRYGIIASSPYKADCILCKLIGREAQQWRFEAKPLSNKDKEYVLRQRKRKQN